MTPTLLAVLMAFVPALSQEHPTAPPAAPKAPSAPKAPAPPSPPKAPAAPKSPTAPAQAVNTLSKEERAAGWILLFDGTEPGKNFRGYRKDALPEAWKAIDGTLTFVPGSAGGDIVTREQYKSFEFTCDWKVGAAGNSGLMWHVSEEFGAPYETGPEMQILDDAGHVDGRTPFTSAGACYALYPAPTGAVKPAGEWNTARILVDGSQVKLWLNGVQTAEFDTSSADWKQRIAGSKFKSMPNFATKDTGHIALQDHGDQVSFRNLKLRPIQ